MTMNNDDKVTFELTEDERRLLYCGLHEWGGPACCTEELAKAMGFQSVEDLFSEGRRIKLAIRNGEALSRFDWARALIATEFVFASNAFGSGLDWTSTTPFSDKQTIRLLRDVQRQMAGIGRSLIWAGRLGTRPKRHDAE